MSAAADPYLWLEDVTGERALEWVRARNAATEAVLAATPEFRRLEGEIREILDSDARVPGIGKIGDHYYSGATRSTSAASGAAPRSPSTARRSRRGRR